MIKHTPFHLELPFDDTITIPLTQNQKTIIDRIDSDLASLKWSANFSPSYAGSGNFLAVRGSSNSNVKRQWLHRTIMSRILGRDLVKGEKVDHVNGDPLDNRRENLRLATSLQNNRNVGKRSDNKSGFKGVYWYKAASKWRAQIRVNKRAIHLGQYDTPEEAYEAYCQAAKYYFGEFARSE